MIGSLSGSAAVQVMLTVEVPAISIVAAGAVTVIVGGSLVPLLFTKNELVVHPVTCGAYKYPELLHFPGEYQVDFPLPC